MTTQEQETLERLIDSRGLFSVLDCISGICGAKAEHVLTNWQDLTLANEWNRATSAVDSAASKILDLAI